MNYLIFFLCSAGFLVSGALPAFAGTTTLTTYYPAPNGNYAQLRLFPNSASLSNPCKTGSLYVDNTGKIQYCDNSNNDFNNGNWVNIPGAWTQSGNNIYPTDTATNPNLNVGIGVTSPVSKLHIHGHYNNDGTGGFMLDANDMGLSEKYVLRINPFVVGAGMVGYQFQTKSSVGGTNVPLTFDNAGNVGIGVTNPGRLLEVNSGVNPAYARLTGGGEALEFIDQSLTHFNWITGAQYNTSNAFEITPSTAAGGTTYSTPAVTVLQNGYVGIGLRNPAAALDVNGNVNVSGSVTSTGGFFYSDERLKKNIHPIDRALDKVEHLSGVSFAWKKDGKKDIGVVAQNVEKVLPELVGTGKDGMKTVKYGNIVAVLIEAVKEQQKEIEDLKKKVAVLEHSIGH